MKQKTKSTGGVPNFFGVAKRQNQQVGRQQVRRVVRRRRGFFS